MKSKFFAKLANVFAKSETTNVVNVDYSTNVVNPVNFEKIETILQYNLCKDIVSDSRVKVNHNENGCIYSPETIQTAKTLLSQLRQNDKKKSDYFANIRKGSKAHTETAIVVSKQSTIVLDDTQNNVKERAHGALNYAIRKYNSNNIVTITEIKAAFNSLSDTDVYRYYSISTMQFNARALFAKCVSVAIAAKVKAAKAAAKAAENV